MSATLLDRVRELAALRAAALATVVTLRDRRAAFDRDNAALIQMAKEQAAAAVEAENFVKACAVIAYRDSGEKKPVAGVEIKMFNEYLIDEEAGLAWAIEKQLCLIPASLDLAAIKKLATVQKLPFVLIDEVPKAQVATDLEKALATQQLTAVGT